VRTDGIFSDNPLLSLKMAKRLDHGLAAEGNPAEMGDFGP
jgi:hypothetical protein